MKISIDCYTAKRMMQDWNRDYYTVNGLAAILDYFDEVDENTEFDPVAICCDCTEYGQGDASCDFEDLINDYGYLLDRDEWMQEQTTWGMDADEDFDSVSDMY